MRRLVSCCSPRSAARLFVATIPSPLSFVAWRTLTVVPSVRRVGISCMRRRTFLMAGNAANQSRCPGPTRALISWRCKLRVTMKSSANRKILANRTASGVLAGGAGPSVATRQMAYNRLTSTARCCIPGLA